MKVFYLPRDPAGLIFDIDSTLYKNEAYARSQVDGQIARFAKTSGISFEAAASKIEEARRACARPSAAGGEGAQVAASLGNALAVLGVPIEESVRWREELIHPEQFLKRDEALIEALAALRKRFSFCALTNNPASVGRRTLEALGVSHLFEHLIGLDDFMLSKPEKRLFVEAAARCGVAVERAVSIGDRFDVDIAAPLALGMGGILVDGPQDVCRLPDVLGGIKAKS